MSTTPGLPCVLMMNAVAAIDYSLIMPTGWQYISELGGSEMFYGITIAAYPIGRLCVLLPMGAWSDVRPFRAPFCTACIFGCIGGCIYGLAAPCQNRWLALIGRFLNGCGATAPTSAWAARAYPPSKRVQIESLQKSAQLIGVMLGPALNVFFTQLDLKAGFLEINPRTCAGYAPAFFNILLLIGFLRYVGEPPRSTERTSADSSPLRQLGQSGSWVCLVIAVHSNLQITAVDVIVSPMTSQHLGFNLLQNSFLFAGMAILALIGAVLGIVADKKGVGPLKIMLAGALLNLVSTCFICLSLLKAPDVLPMEIFMPAAACMIIAILIYGGPTGGVYQQACGNAQGLLGAIYTMAYASGRPIGAILAGGLLAGDVLPFCCVSILLVCSSVGLQCLMWERLDRTTRRALLETAAIENSICET